MILYEKALLADGWKEYPDHLRTGRTFFKRFQTPTRCFLSDERPGVQIEMHVVEYTGEASMRIRLLAMVKDGTWFSIENYALPKTVEEVTALIPRLLYVWEASNSK